MSDYSPAYLLLMKAFQCWDTTGEVLMERRGRPEKVEETIDYYTQRKNQAMMTCIPFREPGEWMFWFGNARLRMYPTEDKSDAKFVIEMNSSEGQDKKELHDRVVKRCTEIFERMKAAGLKVELWP
jgi:hypothetical protein